MVEIFVKGEEMSEGISVKYLFKEILDDNEQVFWEGKPEFLPYVIKGVPFLFFGAIWFYFDYEILKMMDGAKANVDFARKFLIVHLAPSYLAVLFQIYLILSYRNVAYLITHKRVIRRTGLFGIDYSSIDFDKINNIKVSVNPVEKLFSVGSINVDSGKKGGRYGQTVYEKLSAIVNPYEVFKHLKKLSHDVRSDISFPNEMRPKTNSGYSSKYKNNFKSE